MKNEFPSSIIKLLNEDNVVWFNFLSNRPTPTDDGHKYLNGRYLITGLRHQIKSNLVHLYIMNFK